MSDLRRRALQSSPSPSAGQSKPPPSPLVGIAANLLLPVLIFNRLRTPCGDLAALLASAVAPLAWALREFALRRRPDLLSSLALGGVALSLLAFACGGGGRALQLRQTFVVALIGVAFLASAASGRPLVSSLARAGAARKSREALAAFDAREGEPVFRRKLMVMTLAWGGGLTVAALAAFQLAFLLPPGTFLIVGPAVGYATMAALALWTWWYRRRRPPQRNGFRAASRPPADPAARLASEDRGCR